MFKNKPKETLNMNNKIKTRSLILEELDLDSGAVTTLRKTLKTSIANISLQLKEDEPEAKKLAKAIRFQMSKGATLPEALKAIASKKESK